jgi:predicted flap endonuclease-1-like 5' DNA nuclease
MTNQILIASVGNGALWLIVQFLGMILLTALLTWLLCRWFYKRNHADIASTEPASLAPAKAAASAAKPAAPARSQAEKDASAKLKADRDAARKEVETLKAQLANVAKDVVPGSALRDAQAAMKAAADEAAAKISGLEKVKAQYEELKKEKQTLNTKLDGIQKDSISLAQFNEVQRKLADQSRDYTNLAQALKDAQAKAQQATEALVAARSEARDASAEVGKLRKNANNLTASRDETAVARNQTDNALEEAQEEIARLKSQLREAGRGAQSIAHNRAETSAAVATASTSNTGDTLVSSLAPAAVPAGPSAEDFRTISAASGRSIKATSDLVAIEGIGPKIQEALNEIGIFTWSDVVKADLGSVRAKLTERGYHTAVPDSWPQQAALLVAGKWDEFKALCERLDGGVDKSV